MCQFICDKYISSCARRRKCYFQNLFQYALEMTLNSGEIHENKARELGNHHLL